MCYALKNTWLRRKCIRWGGGGGGGVDSVIIIVMRLPHFRYKLKSFLILTSITPMNN